MYHNIHSFKVYCPVFKGYVIITAVNFRTFLSLQNEAPYLFGDTFHFLPDPGKH